METLRRLRLRCESIVSAAKASSPLLFSLYEDDLATELNAELETQLKQELPSFPFPTQGASLAANETAGSSAGWKTTRGTPAKEPVCEDSQIPACCVSSFLGSVADGASSFDSFDSISRCECSAEEQHSNELKVNCASLLVTPKVCVNAVGACDNSWYDNPATAVEAAQVLAPTTQDEREAVSSAPSAVLLDVVVTSTQHSSVEPLAATIDEAAQPILGGAVAWRLPMAVLHYMSLLSRAILKLTLSLLFLV